ncbi:phosphate signaling complex protein PhoU [Candidatus Poribacteria bacterium]|nr:phosphate signaling complex protein PhoU [Candidatus Poribacteria bacterium]
MLEKRISQLKEKLLFMASVVEQMIRGSIKALVERDEELAKKVIEEEEPKVNQLEMEIDDMCISLLALYQPEASDLRTVTMVMKINIDLERVGDHAVNIAERAIVLLSKPPVKPLIDMPRMAEETTRMLCDSLNSFTNADADLAMAIRPRDEVVDALRDGITRELITYMIADPKTIDRSLQLLLIARDLERVADLATNIAEDVFFMVKGETIKHPALKLQH